MTTHTNCTHPATKAARAKCRKGTPQPTAVEAGLNSPLAKAGAVDYATMDYAFETTECPKCWGSSQPGFLAHYAGIYGGVCFSCNKGGGNTTGRKLTRAGAAAKKAHDEWVTQHLSVRLDTLKPGDKFRPSMVEGWKTIVEIDPTPRYAGKMTIGSGDNAVTTEMWHITITTKKTTYSLDKDRTVVRAATQDERSALMAHLANRKGFILTPKAD